MNNSIKVLIADDHALVRIGTKVVLERNYDLSQCDFASNGDEVIFKVQNNRYDLVILDINMPNTDALSLVKQVLSIRPDSKILMQSVNQQSLFAKKFLHIGAVGYIQKDISDEIELRKAIDKILSGKPYINEDVVEQLVKNLQSNSVENPFSSLTNKEVVILNKMLEGKSPQIICKETNLKNTTVSTHKKNILAKLGIDNTMDLFELANLHNYTFK